MKKHELELDYLAPFLAQIGDPAHISKQEAYKLKEECLQDLKHRLIDKANLIQARFEKVWMVCYLRTGHKLLWILIFLVDTFSCFMVFAYVIFCTRKTLVHKPYTAVVWNQWRFDCRIVVCFRKLKNCNANKAGISKIKYLWNQKMRKNISTFAARPCLESTSSNNA